MAEVKSNTRQNNDTLTLRDIVSLCKSHWLWFVISIVITMTCAFFYILTTPSEYTQSASLLIKDEGKGKSSFSSQLSDFGDMGMFSTKSEVNNELKAMKSPAVIAEAVKRLNLNMNYTEDGTFHVNTLYGSNLPITATVQGLTPEDNCSFNVKVSPKGEITLSEFKVNGIEKEHSDIKAQFGANVTTPAGIICISKTPVFKAGEDYDINVERNSINDAIDTCIARLDVQRDDKENSIIDLTYNDYSLERAKDFLGALISAYNELWMADKRQTAINTSKFITDRLAVIEQELGNVDSDISSFKSEHLVPDVQEASRLYMNQASLANTEIMALENELQVAKYIRGFISSPKNAFQLFPANLGLSNQTIALQIADYNEKVIERNSLVANSSLGNPLVQNLDHSLASMRRAIITSIDNQITALNTQIRGFKNNAAENTARIQSSPSQAKYLLSVERQQKVKESLYLYLLQKREENELSLSYTAYNTRLITPPSGNPYPTSPKRNKIYFLAIVIGILLPVVVIYFREVMNTKVRGRKDIDRLTLPFLGEVAMYRSSHRKRRKAEEEANNSILVAPRKGDVLNESFRVLRTNIEFIINSEKKSHLILTTSFNPGSGKSFISTNLAASFSIKENRTILVDLDLRKASLDRYFGAATHGVSDYLSGRQDDWKPMVKHVDGYPGLDVLEVGAIPPNPTELVLKPRMEQLLNELRENYDIIILDCPPVDIVADTAIIDKYVDLTLFVIRAGLLERDMLPVIEEFYQEGRFKNMVTLLNGSTSGGRYGYSQYGYGSHYGYGYGYGRKK